MSDNDDFSIDCATCIGHGTTACNDCIVTHLLANDDGPIDLVVAIEVVLEDPAPIRTPQQRAIALLAKAGLLDDDPVFVPFAEFEAAGRPPRHLQAVSR